MVGKQGPGETDGISLFNNNAQPVDKIISVTIVGKDVAPLDTANDDMVQGAWCVQSGLTWHGGKRIKPVPSRRSLGLLILKWVFFKLSTSRGYLVCKGCSILCGLFFYARPISDNLPN